MTRGIANRNPGNIRRSAGVRYKGEVEGGDPEFRTFRDMAWGYRALFVLLHTYACRHGCRTLRAAVGRYAPPSENDTRNYLRFVTDRTGIGADESFATSDEETMSRIVAAISHFENGTPADPREIAEGWALFAADFLRR